MKRILGTLCFVLLVVAAVFPLLRPGNFPADDSFFYLIIARNWAEGMGSSFHGISETNGYHPLWMQFCRLGEALFGENDTNVMRFMMVIAQLMVVGSIVLLRWGLQKWAPSLWWAGFSFFALVCLTGLYLSEGHVNLLAISAFLATYLRWRDSGSLGKLAVIGTCGGVAVLARLDNIFITGLTIGVLCILLLLRTKGSFLKKLLPPLALGLPAVIVVAPYLAWNVVKFGHLTPISGSLKTTFPHLVFNLSALSSLQKLLIPILLGSLLLTLVLAWRNRRTRAAAAAFIPPALGCLVFTTYLVCGTDHATQWSWYSVGTLVTTVFLLGFLAQRLREALTTSDGGGFGRWITPAAALASVILCGLTLARNVVRHQYAAATRGGFSIETGPEYRLRTPTENAKGFSEHVAEGTRILIYDQPGSYGFYIPQGRFVPVDGLVNDFEFRTAVFEETLKGWMKKRGVSHVLAPRPMVDHLEPKHSRYRTEEDGQWFSFFVMNKGERKETAPIFLRDADILVRSSEVLPEGYGSPVDVCLWKIGGADE